MAPYLKYSSLPQEESADFKETGFLDEDITQTRSRQKRMPLISWCLQAILFTVSCYMLYIAKYGSNQDCQAKTAVWSPAYDDLGYEHTTIKFNGSFSAENKYKGPPSPELDAAWSEIEDGKASHDLRSKRKH